LQQTAETATRYAQTHVDESTEKAFSVQPVTVRGRPETEILDYADSKDIGLIVMATHGRSGAKRWFLGSVANKVVRAAERPVVLVRCSAALDELRERGALRLALVPCDGSQESEAVIPYTAELASRLGMEVVLFQAVEQPYQVLHANATMDVQADLQVPFSPQEMEPLLEEAEVHLERASAAFRDRGVETRTEVRIGDPAEEIVNLAVEIEADLVAMSTRGRSGFSRWAFGSVAEKVLYSACFPLLLVRPAPIEQE
jgi:nucleotide-binding universal stress UspA family protein